MIATIGWCFGGGIALSYALGGDKHEGTAIFYGSLIDDPEQMKHIGHEVYGTFAANDRGIPVEHVNAFVEALREAGIENDVHIYDESSTGSGCTSNATRTTTARPRRTPGNGCAPT
jgi:carboxymethylenebutenolidase